MATWMEGGFARGSAGIKLKDGGLMDAEPRKRRPMVFANAETLFWVGFVRRNEVDVIGK